MTTRDISIDRLTDAFRAGMRLCASSISLVTARDAAGGWHGMAVTSATSLSLDPPSMLVAVNRSASVHPVILGTGRFTLNLLGEGHAGLLERFSRSDLRDQRFQSDDWTRGADGSPVLRGALSTHICSVAETHEFGTHTVVFGCVEAVLLPDGETAMRSHSPILWMNGARASVASPATV